MKLRKVPGAWLFGILAALLLVAVACGPSEPDDAGPAGASAGANASGSGDSGVLVTETRASDTEASAIWIGAETVLIPEVLAGLIGLPAGERVVWVNPGGPASGVLILGDQITAIDSVTVDAENGLPAILASRAAGESASFSVLRGGEVLELRITLALKPVHGSTGSLAGIQDLFDRALGGEFRFLDSVGEEHSGSFFSGTLSEASDDRVTLASPGAGPTTMTLSPNVFVWIDGAPGTTVELAGVTGGSAKVIVIDDVVLAVLAGGLIPPTLETLEGLLGSGEAGAPGLLEKLGALESLQGLFGGGGSSTGDAGL